MSDYSPKEGDVVRATVEGTVTCVLNTPVKQAAFSLSGGGSSGATIVGRECVVAIEKISASLPTAPGSVVRRRDLDVGGWYYRLLHTDGRWYGRNSCSVPVEFIDDSDTEVVFDAGGKPSGTLPTAAGSVIERPSGSPRRVLVRDTWVCVSHDDQCGEDIPASLADEMLTGYEVRFDAGVKS